MRLPLAQVNSLNHPALTLAHQRCPHRWSRAVQNAAIGGRKHREILSESRTSTFQSSVLIGGRTEFKFLRLNQTGSEAELFHIPARLCSRIIYPMIYSPSVWHRISLSASSNHGPASAVRSREQCPGPAVLRLEEGGISWQDTAEAALPLPRGSVCALGASVVTRYQKLVKSWAIFSVLAFNTNLRE